MIALLLVAVAGCGSENQAGDADTDQGDSTTEPCDYYTDEDGDTIADQMEGYDDFDGDGIPNLSDHDSDGDTVPDSIEAGDDDICNHPANSDWGYDSSGNPTGDPDPDFLDLDSDNDGLTDAEERELGTERTDRDTDNDGLTDKAEVCFGLDPLDPASSTIPDVVHVILPYMAPEHEFTEFTFTVTTDTPVDVTASVEECPLPHCHDFTEAVFSCFVKDIRVLSAHPGSPEGFAWRDDTTFYGVNPGTELTFEVDLYNDCWYPDVTSSLGGGCFVAHANGETEIERQEFIVSVPYEGRPSWP